MKSIFHKCYDDFGNLKDNALNIAYNLGKKEGLRKGKKIARAEVINNINNSIHEIYKCQFYCMADMCEHDSPTVDMCIDCLYDAIQKMLERLKENK